ncbi:MAG: FHA domain-containing protein [Anaerolineae bacterium]|jgi:pSer/pThr/pTyr-binding forkhead associated (FHA) protein|nr:FHA domain-containing protein [Anaerolineae bacterium]
MMTNNDDKTLPQRPDKIRRTQQIPAEWAEQTSGGATAAPWREIVLIIRGVVERIPLEDGFSVLLGRSEPEEKFRPDIDLGIYGAFERGISRRHARLFMENDTLYVVDLDSTNGTYLSGTRIPPHTPTPLALHDDLQLGTLHIKIILK